MPTAHMAASVPHTRGAAPVRKMAKDSEGLFAGNTRRLTKLHRKMQRSQKTHGIRVNATVAASSVGSSGNSQVQLVGVLPCCLGHAC